MMTPLDDDEDSRLIKRLSPNGTSADYIEVRLTRVGTSQKIELRQMRPNRDPKLRKAPEQGRSIFLTQYNWNELQEIENELPEIEQT